MFDDFIFPNTEDPDYRFQIYMDWKNVRKKMPNVTPQEFCKNKNLPFPKLEEIVREFDSYDPDGKRWPV